MDRRQLIIDSLEKLRKKEVADKNPFKARAYAKVIQQLKAQTKPIKTTEDLEGIDGIGEKIKLKIQEIIATGKLKQAEEVDNRPDLKAVEELIKVFGIGPTKAKKLVEENQIMSIADLEHNKHLLNDKQLLGLQYWEYFEKRIPRIEMDKHAIMIKEVIKTIDKQYVVELSGSYRRGEPSSGDIDVLITHPSDELDHIRMFSDIISAFKNKKYVTDIFAQGPKKCLAVCRAKNHKTFRRIDFMFTHKHEFPFALLYFTGSGPFNVALRNYTLEKGYSLSEYGLKCTRGPRGGDFANHDFRSEDDIFAFLKIKYVPPTERKDSTCIIPV